MPRIALQQVNHGNITHQDMWFNQLNDRIGKVANPDTEFEHPYPDSPALERAAPGTIQQYFMLLNNRNMVEPLECAAKQDYDGILIAGSSDPVLKESRATVDVHGGMCA